jgi:DNA-binding response OmpR family regulator
LLCFLRIAVVSSDLPPIPRSTSNGTILLLEEYDALAAAISSALKKFAPQLKTTVARTLVEAEGLVAEISPDLFIVDFDPAFPGLTEFLQKIRAAHGDARVLVLGPAVSDEIAVQSRSLGALQFVRKPFELPEFGAAVQASLGPGRNGGSLRSIGLADIIFLQAAGEGNVALQVETSKGRSGEVHMTAGQLVHANAGKLTDAEALEEMLSWPEPEISEKQGQGAAPRTLREPWTDLVFESLRKATLGQPSPGPAPPRAKTGKKIVVVDDTEMLLIFVEDTLVSADLDLQIATARNGLSAIQEIERNVPDLVLLDYSLPDITGGEVCRRLLRNKRTAKIPVLMMSGHVREMAETAAKFDNVVATIEKPFLSEALAALVKQTLAGVRIPARKVPKAAAVSPPPAAFSPPPEQIPPMPKIPEVPIVRAPSLIAERTTASAMSAPIFSTQPNDVVLALFLEVLSMQLTASLRMGEIRAKPSSSAVSLHVSPAALRAALPVETSFELGRVELDGNGRIATVRLIPTIKPFQRLPTRNGFDIGGVAVVPINSHEQVQLTSTSAAPMRMQLLTHFELAGVELSPNFQVAQLVLKMRSTKMRVTLSSEAIGQEQAGATCEAAAVRLDGSAKLAELLLNPVK